jgi:hypothetical protein
MPSFLAISFAIGAWWRSARSMPRALRSTRVS